MSIYVYITRRENPTEDGPNIGEAEWLAAIADDASFRQPTAAEVGVTRGSGSHYKVWTDHPEGSDAWFSWSSGQINVRNPDAPMVAKAMDLARRLDANVVSEMGEIFHADGSHKGFVDGEPW